MESKTKNFETLQGESEEYDFWDTVPDIIKSDIDATLLESENGDVFPHEQIKKRMQNTRSNFI